MSYTNNATTSTQDFIIKKIQSGSWKENERIWTESKLTKQLDVSRIAVREAIAYLSSLKVLKRVQGSGTYVCPANERSIMGQQLFSISPEEAISLMELRIILDTNSVKLFIEKADDEDIKKLENCYYDMVNNRHNPEEFNQYATHFHTIISDGSKNPFISMVSTYLANFINQEQELMQEKTGVDIALNFHFRILKSIKERDGDFAALYIQRDIETTMDHFKATLNESDEKKLVIL